MLYSLFVILGLLAQASNAAYCSGSPDPGTRTNENPILDGELIYVKSVENGILYKTGPENAQFPVVHVYGSAYEMGYAQGQLQTEYVREFVFKTYAYLVDMAIEELGDKLSPAMQAYIIMHGMNRALDWTAEVTAPFTPQAYYDELQGIADATQVDYQTLLRLNMFAELTKASCSFFGAWGSATASTGKTFQLRALDYDTTGPFKDYPQITVYHPDDGFAFANVGWPASIGVLTGISSQQLSVSEIGVSFPDDSFGQGTDNTPPEKVKGEPWMFIVRDVLQHTDSLDAGLEYIENANRTCNLIIGLGDGEEGLVNGIEYSGYVAIPYNDSTLLPVNDTWHPQIEGVVYNGMDWLCPAYTEVLGEQLALYHGSIDEVVTVHDILPTVQTGDLHIAVYDLTDMKLHVSFCRTAAADPTEPHYAYERQFTRLDMASIFAVPNPSAAKK